MTKYIFVTGGVRQHRDRPIEPLRQKAPDGFIEFCGGGHHQNAVRMAKLHRCPPPFLCFLPRAF